ncbi:MAG: hypothetical protein EHM12_12500 [Dehalococcoidia bacterium]|nr:MAG: hypothetical protein EHM12_12500 [Dehalococcoidia bacterium]
MKLYSNWKEILVKAWSIRFMLIAGVLSGIEIVLPLFADQFPRHVFASLSFVFVSAAFVSRLVAQRDV